MLLETLARTSRSAPGLPFSRNQYAPHLLRSTIAEFVRLGVSIPIPVFDQNTGNVIAAQETLEDRSRAGDQQAGADQHCGPGLRQPYRRFGRDQAAAMLGYSERAQRGARRCSAAIRKAVSPCSNCSTFGGAVAGVSESHALPAGPKFLISQGGFTRSNTMVSGLSLNAKVSAFGSSPGAATSGATISRSSSRPRCEPPGLLCEGEAVLLGVDGCSDFDGLHSRQQDEEVQFYASTCWPLTARTSGSCP